MNFVRPASMMLELFENSPAKNRGALNPVPVMLWWITFLFGSFGFLLLGFNAEIVSFSSTGLKVVAVVTLVAAASALLQVYIVQAVTDAQQVRRRRR